MNEKKKKTKKDGETKTKNNQMLFFNLESNSKIVTSELAYMDDHFNSCDHK